MGCPVATCRAATDPTTLFCPHLCGARDHVFHVIRVPGAIDVCVVALVGLVLHVRGVDGDATGPLLRRLVNVLVRHRLGFTLLRQDTRDGGCQRRLAVVHMPNRTNVHVRLRPLVRT